MALHSAFPRSPYEIPHPDTRWFPANSDLSTTAYDKLLPPLVAKLREEVYQWRLTEYDGASDTSKALLRHWFSGEHQIEDATGDLYAFQYYYAQREAVETIIWLYEVKKARDKFDLLRFDSSEAVSTGMFDEDWTRYVIKMATGSGKTKVLSLLLAWSYFHKLYEDESRLSRNFLVIAPNIIVLDRLRTDFDGLKIFFNDPILPPNGYEGRDWTDDFQMTVHLQDDVRVLRSTGNIFLTNIHRVYLGDVREPSLEDDDLTDYFFEPFGEQPRGKTTDSKTDLGEIIREIDELAIFNDEAHHIHNPKLAWFKSIEDIHNKMLQRDVRLSFQIDVTATPKHDNGSIFVQTVADYPLVEAIYQDVVKHPVLPDAASRSKLSERQTAIFADRYQDYLALGVEEWKKSFADHDKLGKKAILFVMVDDTKNCDEVGKYLEKTTPELEGAVLVIHTKNNGEISEAASGKNQEELRLLREQANTIDKPGSPYKAIVSVLMLKEGWDVRNVTTIVGLRSYSSKANILPEQTLGRGLRKMYFGEDVSEAVSVIGTPAFMDFVESIQSEGVTFDYAPMGAGAKRLEQLIVEPDPQKTPQELEELDIPLPVLGRKYHREFKALEELDPSRFGNERIPRKTYTEEETREIVFKTLLDGEEHHTITLAGLTAGDYRAVVAFFARSLLKDLKLVGGYDVLYGMVKRFIGDHLFDDAPVNLEDPQVLRSLSEAHVTKLIFDTFTQAINALTVRETGSARIEAYIRLRETRPFRTENRAHRKARKSVFNLIVGEANAGGLELSFADFLDRAPDVTAFAKNYMAVGFKVDYVRANGELSNYVPDFIVRDDKGKIWIVETKGREEIDLPQKMLRLKQWCADAVAASEGQSYGFVYVDQEGFESYRPDNFSALVTAFNKFQA